jgi:hypothetical protein
MDVKYNALFIFQKILDGFREVTCHITIQYCHLCIKTLSLKVNAINKENFSRKLIALYILEGLILFF